MSRRTARALPWDVRDERLSEVARRSEAIRAHRRSRETAWTVFEDEEVPQPRPAVSTPRRRESLVRRRPTTWREIDASKDEEKENAGYVVRRPASEAPPNKHHIKTPSPSTKRNCDTAAAGIEQIGTAAGRTTTPKSKGKRKLSTSTTKKITNTSKKQPKKATLEIRVPATPSPAPSSGQSTPSPSRRALQDITHLFGLDPTAHYFQPWQRAVRLLLHASSLRIQ